jgi:hypothetical protein
MSENAVMNTPRAELLLEPDNSSTLSLYDRADTTRTVLGSVSRKQTGAAACVGVVPRAGPTPPRVRPGVR